MFLALKGDGLATIAEVAKAYGISKNHLMKVAHQLGVAGYVETVRGKSGALRVVLSKARDAFFSALDGHTLADLVRPRAPLRKLLSFNPNGRTAAAQTSRSVRRA